MIRHTMLGPDDIPLPHEVHPAFDGCFDWHSAIEMHWALVRMLRLSPDSFGCRGSVKRADVTELTPAVDPFSRAGPGDAHLGGDMGDRTFLAALYQSPAAFHSQGAFRWVIDSSPGGGWFGG